MLGQLDRAFRPEDEPMSYFLDNESEVIWQGDVRQAGAARLRAVPDWPQLLA